MGLSGLATWSFDVGSACIGFLLGAIFIPIFIALTASGTDS